MADPATRFFFFAGSAGKGVLRMQEKPETLAAGFARILRDEGVSRGQVVAAYARYKPASGRKMLLSEFIALGLHRHATVPAGFIGAREAAEFAREVNFQAHKRGLVADKLLFDGALRGLGFPVAPIQAIFGAKPLPEPVFTLSNRADIARFLRNEARYPLFGKPLSGQNSDDVISIDACEGREGVLHLSSGQQVAIKDALAGIAPRYFRWGYLFQSRIPQHPALCARIGGTVGSFRVITFLREAEVRIVGAFWKIPRAGMVADNLWRGALIAGVDPATGLVGRVRTGIGPADAACARHPDTGQTIGGLQIPHWPRLVTTLSQAAGLLSGLPLVGWDVAVSPDGPVIIEANTSPSLDLLQYASGKPVLGPALRDEMLAEKSRLARQRRQDGAAARQRLHAKIRARLGRAIGLGRK